MNRKLSAVQVCGIRQHEAREKHEALAAKYGVTRQTISYILAGTRWCWLSTLPPRFSTPARSTP